MKKIIIGISIVILVGAASFFGYQYYIDYQLKKDLAEIDEGLDTIQEQLENSGAMWKGRHLYSANTVNSFGRRAYLSIVCTDDHEFKFILSFGESLSSSDNSFSISTDLQEFDDFWRMNISNNALILTEPESIEFANSLKQADAFRTHIEVGFHELSPNFVIDSENNPISEKLKECKE